MTLHIITPHIYMLYDKKQCCCIYLVLHRLAISYYIHPREYSEKLLHHQGFKTIPIFAEKNFFFFSEILFLLGRNSKVASLSYFRSESKYFIKKPCKKNRVQQLLSIEKQILVCIL